MPNAAEFNRACRDGSAETAVAPAGSRTSDRIRRASTRAARRFAFAPEVCKGPAEATAAAATAPTTTVVATPTLVLNNIPARVPRVEEERTKMLSYANGLSTEPLLGETIGANFERTVARVPDSEALVRATSGSASRTRS